MPDLNIYEVVIGLEVHVQLLTNNKLFCGDSTLFGNPPNTNICDIYLAHPGAFPEPSEEKVTVKQIGLPLINYSF